MASALPGKLVRNENLNLVNQTLGAGPSDLGLNKLPWGDGCKVKFGHWCLGLREPKAPSEGGNQWPAA